MLFCNSVAYIRLDVIYHLKDNLKNLFRENVSLKLRNFSLTLRNKFHVVSYNFLNIKELIYYWYGLHRKFKKYYS
jgi:hypothetical protein